MPTLIAPLTYLFPDILVFKPPILFQDPDRLSLVPLLSAYWTMGYFSLHNMLVTEFNAKFSSIT